MSLPLRAASDWRCRPFPACEYAKSFYFMFRLERPGLVCERASLEPTRHNGSANPRTRRRSKGASLKWVSPSRTGEWNPRISMKVVRRSVGGKLETGMSPGAERVPDDKRVSQGQFDLIEDRSTWYCGSLPRCRAVTGDKGKKGVQQREEDREGCYSFPKGLQGHRNGPVPLYFDGSEGQEVIP